MSPSPEAGEPFVPPSITSTRTCAQFIRALADVYGDRPALVLGETTLSYRDIEERSRRMAWGLLRRGVGKGSRVGMLLSNGPDWVVSWFAITRVGAVAVGLSTFLKPPEIARVVRHGDLHGVITQRAFLGQVFFDNLEEAFEDLADSSPELFLAGAPFLRWIVSTDADSPTWARPMGWLTEAGAADRMDSMLEVVESEIHPEDPAIVIYTSGQSSAPKGVVHSHTNVIDKNHYLCEEFRPEGTIAATMPFFWVGGLVIRLLMPLEAGCVVECTTKPTAGGPALGTVNREVMFTPKGLTPGLGMTETVAVYAWGTEAPHPDHAISAPITVLDPLVEIRVVQEDGTLATMEGERGEMLVRGRGVATGLHKVDRADAFDADGFYRTGDEVMVHGDALCFVGRLGDMIKTAGANVAPAEVEQELVLLPGVRSAHVVAVDVPGRGHLVGAAVIAEEGATLEPTEMATALRSRLSTYKIPRLIALVSAADVPKTPTNKIDKRALASLILGKAEGEAR